MPNLLATRPGRLAAFGLLYLSESVPQGFAGVALATHMRLQGVAQDNVSLFVGMMYLPWSFKWVMGPFVDLFYSDRLGRRRAWIVACQLLMTVTLLGAMWVNFQTQFTALLALIIAHNVFAATQDVAIDALANTVLPENERGTANGVMFGGAYLGNALGGSVALFLSPYVGLTGMFIYVAGLLLAITLFVSCRLSEPSMEHQTAPASGSRIRAVGAAVKNYSLTAGRAFFGSRPAFVGLLFALLPAGAYALSLALQTNLAVELGMLEGEISQLSLYSTIISALCCVAGGYLSDRLGRRPMMAVYILGTAVPALWLAYEMAAQNYWLPREPGTLAPLISSSRLLTVFWAAALIYAVFNGLMYGVRTALFMDLCTPSVAATQFTAYMSMLNFVIFYSSIWQGQVTQHFGYPVTLVIDALFGCVGLVALAAMGPIPRRE